MFGQKQNHNHASTTLFTGLGPRWLFPLPKTEDTDERKAFCYDWGDRNRSCWRYQKARFRSVLRIGKNAGISVLYLRGLTLKVSRYIAYIHNWPLHSFSKIKDIFSKILYSYAKHIWLWSIGKCFAHWIIDKIRSLTGLSATYNAKLIKSKVFKYCSLSPTSHCVFS